MKKVQNRTDTQINHILCLRGFFKNIVKGRVEGKIVSGQP